MKNLFVTGTDTDVGKTLISCGLLIAFQKQGLSTLGYKPISAGCEKAPQGLVNDDAAQLLACSSIEVSLSEVNPIAFEPPIAPHIAANLVDTNIDSHAVTDGWMHLARKRPDVLLTEGAGGWSLPINDYQTLPEVLLPLDMKVVMVVGMRLGCLNHALLTANTIQQQGFTLSGWIANHLSNDMPYAEENIQTLEQHLEAPLIGKVPYLTSTDASLDVYEHVAQYLNPSRLLGN